MKTFSLVLFGEGIIFIKNPKWTLFRGNNSQNREFSTCKHHEIYEEMYDRSLQYKKWHQ